MNANLIIDRGQDCSYMHPSGQSDSSIIGHLVTAVGGTASVNSGAPEDLIIDNNENSGQCFFPSNNVIVDDYAVAMKSSTHGFQIYFTGIYMSQVDGTPKQSNIFIVSCS